MFTRVIKAFKDAYEEDSIRKAHMEMIEKSMKSTKYTDDDFDSYMSTFYQRNWLFADKSKMLKRMNTRVTFAGLGIASQMLQVFIRTGFLNLTFADGDVFELQNSNRQMVLDFFLGKNKALSMQKIAKNINSRGTYNAIPYYLDELYLAKVLPHTDYFINSIDFDSKAYIQSHNMCRALGVKEVFPFVIGDRCVAIVIDPKTSPSFTEYFNTEDPDELKGKIIKFCIEKMLERLPAAQKEKVESNYEQYLENGHNFTSDPQNILGVTSLASLVVELVQDDLDGYEVKTFPEINIR